MFKQIFIAIIIGSFLGLSLTTAYFYSKNKNNPSPPPTENTTIEEEKTEEKNTDKQDENNYDVQENISTTFLDILVPENESIVEKETLSIFGKSNPNNIILINTLDETFHTVSKESGEFDIDITLKPGINILHFTAINSDDSQIEKEILVTYSTAKI
jgi:hypothetical protein